MKIIQSKLANSYKTFLESNGRILVLQDTLDQSGIIDVTNVFGSNSIKNKTALSGTVLFIPKNANLDYDLKIGDRILANAKNVVHINENESKLFLVYSKDVEAIIDSDFEYQPSLTFNNI